MLRTTALLALVTRSVFELGYHRDLSRAAASDLSADARRLIVNANLYVDIRSAVALLLRRRSHRLFRLHFDDCFGGSAFAERWEEVESLITATGQGARHLARSIGRAQHAAQDYYAHSNHVEQVTGDHPSGFEPVTYRTVMEEGRWVSLRSLWAADHTESVNDSLVSGAYFRPTPTITDDRGQPRDLHHRTLNKDAPVVEAGYLYRDYDRMAMHFRALACARLESERLSRLAAHAHPTEYDALQEYRSSPGERLREKFKYCLAVGAAAVTGHWR